MTRDAEHTTSPHSVVVPREPTNEMWAAGERAFDRDPDLHHETVVANIWSAMLAAAPAPSSLAGGEVRAALEPFAKVADTALCPSDEPGDNDFIRLDETIAITVSDIRRAASVFAAISPESPAREGVEKALHLKLIDTLKPFAEVAEKLKHCHVVEICEPTPDNPSRYIIPMPREWFERAADDLEAIAIQLHSDGVLSEGQAANLTGLDRVEVRKQVDALTPRHEAPASTLDKHMSPSPSQVADAAEATSRPVGWERVHGFDMPVAVYSTSDTSPAAPAEGMRAALVEIASRPLLDEPVSADGHRNRCPSCGHAWNIHKTPHHAPTCDRMTAIAALNEAPAEGAGEAVERLRQLAKQWAVAERVVPGTGVQSPRQRVPDYVLRKAADDISTLLALRARSSAPEAREDAQPFAWAYRLNFPDENTAWDWEARKEKMTEDKFGPHGGILETMPLYTHPAAPSADKLRIAVEAFQSVKRHSVLGSVNFNTAVEALAALKAEG